MSDFLGRICAAIEVKKFALKELKVIVAAAVAQVQKLTIQIQSLKTQQTNLRVDELKKQLDTLVSQLKIAYDEYNNFNSNYSSYEVEINSLEREINEIRNKTRRDHFKSIENGEYNVKAGMIYSNLFATLERIGDHLINVTEAITGKV